MLILLICIICWAKFAHTPFCCILMPQVLSNSLDVENHLQLGSPWGDLDGQLVICNRLYANASDLIGVVRACFSGVRATIAGAVRAGLQKLRDCSSDVRRWSQRRPQMPDASAGGEPRGSGACACSACRARLRGRRAE